MKEYTRNYYLSAGECNPQAELPMPLLLTRIIDTATHHANEWGVGYAHLGVVASYCRDDAVAAG